MNKKAQEEMIGFAVILIIVAVIMAVLIGFMVRRESKGVLQSYEIGSFLESMLKYTSTCEDYLGYQDIQELIISCKNGFVCLNGVNSCDLLNSSIENMVNSSWNIGPEAPKKGYRLKIGLNEADWWSIQKGNFSSNYMADSQAFLGRGDNYMVSLRIYS
jgi:hypothetical protein